MKKIGAKKFVMLISTLISCFLSVSSLSLLNHSSNNKAREEKCKNYTKIVKDYDYTKYDSIYFDYENGPIFLDTDLENITKEGYENRPEIFYNDEAREGTPSRDSTGIFYPDTRVNVSETNCSTWPYNAVCRIHSTYVDEASNYYTYISTGALVGPNIFLTASHCVYNESYGWPVEFNVYPGYYYGENALYGHASMIGANVGVIFNTHDANDDWAIVRLNWNIANTVGGYFGVVCENLTANQEVRNIGHQGDRLCLTDAYGPIQTVFPYKFYHTVDAYAGASGSPLFKTYSTNICGIHSAGIHNGTIDVNTAYRVSTYLETWVADDIIDWAIND